MAKRAAARPRWSARRRLYQACLAAALVFLLFGAAELASWNADRARLRAVAVAVAAPAQDEAERLARLTRWVYHNQGFAPNRRHHLWRKLGSTPIQVLEHGGGCADKSKLLVALLRELGVGGSLAMLYPCEGCRSRHTVALVETGAGWTVADPVYDITFPHRHGGFIGIEALRADPAILERRLAELRAARGPADKINRYRSIDHYSLMTTVNWGKNALTRGVAKLLRAAGREPWSTPRPLFLDDPKQFFALLGLGGALGCGLLALLLRPRGSAAESRLRWGAMPRAEHPRLLEDEGDPASPSVPDPALPEEWVDDDPLILWMLSLTPTQRLQRAQSFVNGVRALRHGRA